MRPGGLRDVIHAEPFRPFTMVLVTGARVDVNHPEWIFQPPNARTAIVTGQDESVRIIDVDLIAEVQLGPPAEAGTVAAEPNGG